MILYIVFSILVGLLAQERGKSFLFWTVLSFLFTPYLIGLLLILWIILY